jgi:hypothetical protein
MTVAAIRHLPDSPPSPNQCSRSRLRDDPNGGVEIIIGEGGVEDLVAVALEVGRLDAARSRIKAVEEEDEHGTNRKVEQNPVKQAACSLTFAVVAMFYRWRLVPLSPLRVRRQAKVTLPESS